MPLTMVLCLKNTEEILKVALTLFTFMKKNSYRQYMDESRLLTLHRLS